MSFFDRFRRRSITSSPPPEPSPSEHTPLLVTRCLDQLALLYPEGWRDLEIRAHVENDDAGMFIDRIDVALVANAESITEFPDDPHVRTALLATNLHGLCASVGMSLHGTYAFNAQVTGDSIRILDKTFTSGGVRLYPPSFFIALAPALRGGQHAFHDWQEQFRHRFAERSAGGLRWDRAAGVLALTSAAGETSTVDAHVLGSYAPSEHTWCWVWANSGLEKAEQAAIRRVRDETTLALLREPGFDCTEPFSFAVAALAAHAIDPHLHVWRWPQSAHLFFAVRLA
jgi:hypothetical protein